MDLGAECIENALIEPAYFREDVLGQYVYNADTNEVTLFFKKQVNRVEASVLIEMLADLIIDISQARAQGSCDEIHEKPNM